MRLKHFELAIKVAGLSRRSKRHGAVIAKGSRVLSIGINSKKTHPRSKKPGHTIHAELSALVAAGSSVKGATLYSARVMRNGKLANSKPCDFCSTLLHEAGIRKIVYFNGAEMVSSIIS